MVVTLLTLALISVAARPVTFTYHDANAKQVFISGDFNSWASTTAMARSGNDWTYKFDLPTDARIEYKLIVDGQWVLDPADPVKIGNGMGGENSVWQGPKYRFSARDEEPKNPLVRSELSVEGRTIVVLSPQGCRFSFTATARPTRRQERSRTLSPISWRSARFGPR